MKYFMGVVLAIVMVLSMGVSVPVKSSANDIGLDVEYLYPQPKGEINAWAGDVDGYTTDYMRGGPMEKQRDVQDGWHITATMKYYKYGVTWYYCVDTDDGDYYGWIDGQYLTFYSGASDPNWQPMPRESAATYDVAQRRGEVYAPNGSVYGYTTDYVVYSQEQETQHKVQHTWHITAYTTCYAHGVTWYECWDTDDGDYYGWIDEQFLRFYDEYPRTEPPTEATTTKATTTTAVTTQITTVSEAVTTTEPEITTMSTTMTEQQAVPVAAVANESSDSMFSGMGMIIIIVVAVAVILLAIVAILLILLLMKNSKKS